MGEPVSSLHSSIATFVTSFLLLWNSCLKNLYSAELLLSVLAVAFSRNLIPVILVAGLEHQAALLCVSNDVENSLPWVAGTEFCLEQFSLTYPELKNGFGLLWPKPTI